MTRPRGDTITLHYELARALRQLRKLPSHERAYGARRLLAELAACSTALRQVRREAVVAMRDREGLSGQEIARLLDLSPETVRDVYAGQHRHGHARPGRSQGGGSSGRSRGSSRGA